MAKKISKAKLFWRGITIFLPEYLRVLGTGRISGINKYLQMLYFTVENERLVEHTKKAVVQLFVPPIPSRPFARYLRSYTNNLVLKRNNLHLGTVLIATTNECPYDCWYCSARNTPRGELSTDSIEQTINVLRSWGTSIIGFTGGEPLLRTDTDEIIQRYRDDFTFLIFTSGYGLDLNRAKKLKEIGLFYIAISLDDYREEQHDRARGRKGAFKTSLSAIQNAKTAGLYTIIQSVITPDLLENGQMWNFFEFVQQTGTDELLLLEPFGTGNLMNENDNVFLTTRQHDKLRWFHEAALSHKNLPKITSFADFEDRTRFGCGAGLQHAYIDGNGDLWPCNFLPISLGNMLSEPQLVHSRLKEYFAQPCSECILVSRRKTLQRLAKKQMPIPFARVQRMLGSQSVNRREGGLPAFYAAMAPDDGRENKQ
jgi:MoaA/NifB/PqqE/SkfB family radical SAM enzyme